VLHEQVMNIQTIEHNISLSKTKDVFIRDVFGKLEELLNEPNTNDCCSYGKYNNSYLGYKKVLRKLTKIINNKYHLFGNDSLTKHDQQRHTELRKLVYDRKIKRYTNVCGNCDECLSRRKLWPEGIKFIDHDFKHV